MRLVSRTLLYLGVFAAWPCFLSLLQAIFAFGYWIEPVAMLTGMAWGCGVVLWIFAREVSRV